MGWSSERGKMADQDSLPLIGLSVEDLNFDPLRHTHAEFWQMIAPWKKPANDGKSC
tara:strand:+ start:962 stop:1129 length:168 start_codon:yes stop_codon:yes gene_type:complete